MSISVTFEQGTGFSPRIVRMRTSSTLAQVTAAGWYKNVDPNRLAPSDKVEIYYSDGSSIAANAFFDVSIAAGVVTLSVAESNVILPVVSGDFAVFSGTSGAIDDLGYSPSDAAKTKVSMVGGAVAINRLAKFSDIAGTVDDATSAGTNLGDLYAGADAVAGAFRSYPATTATGYLSLLAVSNSGAFNTIISNAAMGQSSTISIPDPGASTANFLLSTSAAGQSVSASSASATPGTIRALIGAMTESNSVMTSGNVVGVRGVVTNVGASGGFIYGAQGKIISSGTLSGSSWSAGVFGQLDISAATVNAGQMAPIWGDYGSSSGTLTDQTGLYGIAMTNTTAAVLQGQVYLYGGAQNLLLLSTNAGLSGVTYFKDSGTGSGSWGNATPPTPSKVLKISVDGADYYLPLVAQNS